MKMFRGDRIRLHFPLLILLFSSSAICGGQPFLNSLAVLFRARPPWPTIFPSSKMTPIPAPFVSMANTPQQGILVAHPMSPSSSSFETAVASASSNSVTEPGKSKKPDSIGEALDQSLAQPMRTSLPTIPPTLQPLIPIFPQPLPAGFQNDLTRGAVEHAKALGLPPPPSSSSLDQGKAFGNQVSSSAEQISSAGQLHIIPSPADFLKPLRVLPSPVDKGAYLQQQQQQQQQQQRQQQQQQQQRQQQEQHQQQQQQQQRHHQRQQQQQRLHTLRPSPQRHHHHHQQQQHGNLVSLPTSVVSTVSLPDVPSTVAQYGIIVDGNLPVNGGNSRKKFRYHHQQQEAHEGKYEVGGARRHPAWNPLTAATATNYNNNDNNNHNDSYHNVNNPPFYESSRKHKKLKDFRPSPQLNSFVETTVFTDYATHMNANGGSDGRAHHDTNANEPPTQPKYESGFRPITFNQYAPNYGTTATRPHYTNSHSQYYNPWSIAFNPDQQQEQEQQAHNQNNQSAENQSAANNHNDNYSANKSGSQENFELSVEETKGAHLHHQRGKPFRKDRKILSSSTLSHEIINNSNESKQSGSYSREDGDGRERDDVVAGDVYERIYIGNRGKTKSTTSSEELRKSRHPFSSVPSASAVVKGKKQVIVSSSSSSGIPSATISSTTASSELVEEWLPPGIRIEKKSDGRKKYPTYNKHIRRAHHNPNNNNKPMGLKGLMKLPDKCEKFNRFGFCPVTRQYPLEAAEKIASRCSALLSHLIAPLPKMDVQYDISEDPKNRSGGGGSGGGGKRSTTGWTWKSYMGKPVCDTDELTTVPGWARNEHGDWLIILQTKAWQQKAHISLCSPAATHCQGLSCANSGATTANSGERKASGDVAAKDTKCVQRFTAQRLAVFDPDNPDRCPVVRSVFLPSACVCLTNRGMTGPAVASPNSRERDLDGNYSSSSGRQPLFSSSKEITGGGGEETDDDDGGEYVRTFPDSAEALSMSSSERRARRPVGTRRIYSSSSVEGRASNEIQQPTIFTSFKDPRNATFMIITEKFTTKESSKEEIARPPTVRVVHGGTSSSIRVSPR